MVHENQENHHFIAKKKSLFGKLFQTMKVTMQEKNYTKMFKNSPHICVTAGRITAGMAHACPAGQRWPQFFWSSLAQARVSHHSGRLRQGGDSEESKF